MQQSHGFVATAKLLVDYSRYDALLFRNEVIYLKYKTCIRARIMGLRLPQISVHSTPQFDLQARYIDQTTF